MKHKFLLIVVVVTLNLQFLTFNAFSQGIAINTDGSNPDNSAMLDVKSTTSGLLVPRMTTAQRDAIVSPAMSLLIYNTDCKEFQYYNGQWIGLQTTPHSFLNSVSFNYTGSVQTWTVPAGVCRIKIKCWGAGGGSGGYDKNGGATYYGGKGGGGDYVEAIVRVSPGDVLSVYVGKYGIGGSNFCNNCAGGYGGWGYGHGADGGRSGYYGNSGSGGGGGGSSAVLKGTSVIIVAGGGGGGGGGGRYSRGSAGGAAGSYGSDSVADDTGYGGRAGGSSSSSGTNGTSNTSGDSGGGGGGGGGYKGGTGGSASYNDNGAGGGGGGTSFCSTSNIVENYNIINGSGMTSGNSADPDCTGCGNGGAWGGSGSNGFVKIYY